MSRVGDYLFRSAQRAGEPGATWTGCRDEEEVLRRGWHLTDELVEVTRARADGPQVGDLGTMLLGARRHGKGLFVHVHPAAEGARLRPSGPPSVLARGFNIRGC